jgi:GTP-binding protein HflX
LSELYDILVETPPTKVILLALDQGLWDCERSLAELSALCEANHMEAVAQVTQKRQTPETGIVLGSGKLEEASLAAETLGAECAVFDGELTGSQIRNISNALGGLEVIDRTMLILEIFRSRAVTNEGKLQTELALLRYRLPRLQGMGEALSRQGGGGGGGGITITPVAFIVIEKGKCRMMQINNYTSSADRAVSMIPELVDKLTELLKAKDGKADGAETPAAE